MKGIKVSYYGATDVGRRRKNNEDTLIARKIWDSRHILLAAIDGMGGEDGGEIAADIAEKSMIKYLEENREGTMTDLIKEAMVYANNEIIEYKLREHRLERMGCVATAGILDVADATLSIAHVGDSRLYRYSGNQLEKLTHDHSLVGYQEEQGLLTEKQAMKHPMRSVIERCLGYQMHEPTDKNFVESAVFPLEVGEKFLFCSDGVCDMLTSAQISECLASAPTPEEASRNIINAANKAGGKDNITAVVAYVAQSEGEAESGNDESSEIGELRKEDREEELPFKPPRKGWMRRNWWVLLIFGLLIAFGIVIACFT